MYNTSGWCLLNVSNSRRPFDFVPTVRDGKLVMSFETEIANNLHRTTWCWMTSMLTLYNSHWKRQLSPSSLFHQRHFSLLFLPSSATQSQSMPSSHLQVRNILYQTTVPSNHIPFFNIHHWHLRIPNMMHSTSVWRRSCHAENWISILLVVHLNGGIVVGPEWVPLSTQSQQPLTWSW